MRKYLKQIIWCVTLFLMIGVTLQMADKKAFATSGDWYLEYHYTLVPASADNVENYILIQEYTGTAKTLYVPATAVIDGVTYRTKLLANNKSIWDGTKDTLEKLTFEDGILAEGGFLFCKLKKLKSVNVEALDMSQAKSTAWMFSQCKSLTKLNVSDWDISNVTNMFNMFGGCEKLSSIDVSKWNTSKVTVMTSVFDHCQCLYKIDVEDWDVSNVTMMESMFYKCEKLDSLDLHKWDTSKVTTMWEMFGRCYSLRSINVKGWNTSQVTSMAGLFCCNYSLTSLDLSSFDMSKVVIGQYDDGLFTRCASLKTIKTPKNAPQKLTIDSGLTYVKKTNGKLGKKTYNYIPKRKKSITMVCTQSRSKSTRITSITTSGGKIKLKWKKVSAPMFKPVQYEVQCSTKKNFSDAVGKMTNTTDSTYSVQDNVTDKTSTTIKGLTKGKTYYVRIRVYTYGTTLSKWSAVKKIKAK